MKEKKNSKTSQDNFLESELIDETQVRIPDGYKMVRKYPLKPPFNIWAVLKEKEKLFLNNSNASMSGKNEEFS